MASPKPSLAVATKPVHVGIISHIKSALFQSLHIHASQAVDNAAQNTHDASIFADPVVSQIIADLEKMIEKKLAAYEALQKGHLIASQAAARAKEPEVKPIAVVCPNCQVKSHTIDLSEHLASTHPNTPEPEHAIVHSLPMEVEHSVGSEANPEGPH
jgi:hypothetical protein